MVVERSDGFQARRGCTSRFHLCVSESRHCLIVQNRPPVSAAMRSVSQCSRATPRILLGSVITNRQTSIKKPSTLAPSRAGPCEPLARRTGCPVAAEGVFGLQDWNCADSCRLGALRGSFREFKIVATSATTCWNINVREPAGENSHSRSVKGDAASRRPVRLFLQPFTAVAGAVRGEPGRGGLPAASL